MCSTSHNTINITKKIYALSVLDSECREKCIDINFLNYDDFYFHSYFLGALNGRMVL